MQERIQSRTLDVMYWVQRGIASLRGRILAHGAAWGTDFVLQRVALREHFAATALTYIQLLTLHRDQLLQMLPRYVAGSADAAAALCLYCVLCAVCIALLRWARSWTDLFPWRRQHIYRWHHSAVC